MIFMELLFRGVVNVIGVPWGLFYMWYNIKNELIKKASKMDKKEILKYLETLKSKLQKDGIVSIGLFGSFAKESADKDSDIDILIETSDAFINKYRGWDAFIYIDENIREKISNKFHKKVDIFDKNSNSAIKEQILKDVCYA